MNTYQNYLTTEKGEGKKENNEEATTTQAYKNISVWTHEAEENCCQKPGMVERHHQMTSISVFELNSLIMKCILIKLFKAVQLNKELNTFINISLSYSFISSHIS